MLLFMRKYGLWYETVNVFVVNGSKKMKTE